jgi:hypothetical protein
VERALVGEAQARRVRSGLESYVLLVRNWKAYSDLSPPEELRKLLERLFCG